VFEGPVANLKHKIDLALKSTVGGIVAFAAAVVALGFFCAALFLWIAGTYGAIVASLVLGGAFLAVALIALLVVLILQRRKPPPPPPRSAAWWADPVLLTTALDIGRVLGSKRLTSAVVVGALLFGLLLNRSPPKRED
jgi:hypothetical protein